MRLTEKTENGYYDKDECVISECSDKLGQLEDIMEKYNIENLTDLNVILAEYFAEVKEHSFRCK